MFTLNSIKEILNSDAGKQLLNEALTHRSYAVENNLNYDNQRLEFLGDAVLEIILSEYLFNLYPASPEGQLTQMRSALVCESALARLAQQCQLGTGLRIGRGEAECGGASRESTLADLFEAVTGALFLGAGFDVCRKIILEVFTRTYPDPRQMLIELNPKGKLQEYTQQHWGSTPVYKVFFQSGPQHAPYYEVEVQLRRYIAIGNGPNRKSAEGDAARKLYQFLTAK